MTETENNEAIDATEETDADQGDSQEIGSDDGEELSDEERDARHDLFGELIQVMCGG